MKESWEKLYCLSWPHLKGYGVISAIVIGQPDSSGNIGLTSDRGALVSRYKESMWMGYSGVAIFGTYGLPHLYCKMNWLAR